MDKENLYYVVRKGTNVRERESFLNAWIGDKDKAEMMAEYNSNLFKKEWVIISIKDYEEKYTEKATGE